MSRQVLTTLDFNAVGKIIGLPDGVNPQDAATVAQLTALTTGLSWKTSVRAASTANINLAAPGAAIDGVSMAASDRFLAKDETAGATNGIYIWNGAATPATRATDADTARELESAVVSVEEGTVNAGTTWRQTVVNATLGTTPLVWTTFGTVSAPASETVAGIAEVATQAETDTGTDDTRMITPLKLANYTAKKLKVIGTVGDGSATQYTLTHNLNTRSLFCSVYRNSGAYDQIECDIEFTTVNTITVRFNAAPTAAQFAYTILG
jgi:hypothetical protein